MWLGITPSHRVSGKFIGICFVPFSNNVLVVYLNNDKDGHGNDNYGIHCVLQRARDCGVVLYFAVGHLAGTCLSTDRRSPTPGAAGWMGGSPRDFASLRIYNAYTISAFITTVID